MKKIILLSLCSLFIITGCTFGVGTTPSPSDTGWSSDATMSSSEARAKKAQEAYKWAMATASSKITESEEFGNCMQTSVNMCIQSSGMQLAQKTKSIAFCEELPQKDQKESCKFGIVMTLAIEKQNADECKVLSGQYAKQCFMEVYRNTAIKAKDIALCKKITEIEKQDMATNSGAQAATPTMQAGGEDQCIFSVIMSDETASERDCDRLSNESMVDMCKASLKNRPKLPTNIPAAPTR
jgi:hypothetical protein